MRSNLIAVLGVGMLLLSVFTLTLISQYTGSPPAEEIASTKPEAAIGIPLLWATNEMVYDPASEELDKKYFPGFFEVTDKLLAVNFWFKNPHSQPVKFTVRGRSCTSCTSANVAVIPPEGMASYEKSVAVSRLGTGVVPVPDLVTPLAHLALLDSLKWQPMDFEQPDAGVMIPAAATAEAPTWGVFQVLIKVTNLGPKQLQAEVGMSVGDGPSVRQKFTVSIVGVPALDVTPRSVEFGEFPEGAPPRVVQLYCWSSTREQAELPAPAVSVSGNDPFLQAGTPVPLTPAELPRIPFDPKTHPAPPRVLSGYRIPLTLSRRLSGSGATGTPNLPDIGPFERQVGIATGGGQSVSVTVRATMSGLVGLLDGGIIDLKDFNVRAGVEKSFTLVSDRDDLVLKLTPEDCYPGYLQTTLGEPRTEAGRKYWTLKVVVPPNKALSDMPPESVVVLNGTTGGESVKAKFAVKGRGLVRSR